MGRSLKIAISPCPNDTFMFDGLINGKVDLMGYDFEVTMADIDLLNSNVIEGNGVDVSKISYATYPQICSRYKISPHGSAIGFGNAPLVVTAKDNSFCELQNGTVAIPGSQTTAALLLRYCFGDKLQELVCKNYLFSDIAAAVTSKEVDFGVLIHEERFTYEQRGMKLVADLGQIWEDRCHLPIPLGAIAVSSELDSGVVADFNKILRSSIAFAMANPQSSRSFIKKHAQSLEDWVIDSHIEMFVNQFSLDITEKGRAAVLNLLNVASSDKNQRFDNRIFTE